MHFVNYCHVIRGLSILAFNWHLALLVGSGVITLRSYDKDKRYDSEESEERRKRFRILVCLDGEEEGGEKKWLQLFL